MYPGVINYFVCFWFVSWLGVVWMSSLLLLIISDWGVWDCDNKSVLLVDVFFSRIGRWLLSLLWEQISSSLLSGRYFKEVDGDCGVNVFSMDLGG